MGGEQVALKEMTLYGEIDRVKIAIQRVQEFAPKEGIPIVGFSGGKDSLVLYHICKMAGIEFKPQYSPPSVDPPDVIRFIREEYPDVEMLKYKKNKDGSSRTMWYLISHRALPPSRLMRYCCEELKERTGEKGDTVFTGVRWDESRGRKQRKVVEFFKGKIMIRPIIDWTDADVWEFIKTYNIKYCHLYDEGHKRLGCIGCPLASADKMKQELEDYPKYRANYIRAFERMLLYRKSKNMKTEWQTGEEVMSWWLGEATKAKTLEGQCSMF